MTTQSREQQPRTESAQPEQSAQQRLDRINHIVDLEWGQFQRTTNAGGRAACQNDNDTFRIMRLSQFATWPDALLRSYEQDLEQADTQGRNLVTEKYARMMASTVPDEYERAIAPYLPELSEERTELQERIIAIQVRWAQEFRKRYPKLGSAMRVLRTSEDTPQATSFETYLRGELSTYSPRTLEEYAAFVERLCDECHNLTQETVLNTVRMSGFSSLDEAENCQ
ncbi:DUF4125 family protein [Bifidobacterium magnum]|uniref:DUF4125 domain-containing protein n=1 Tax=Bifidobacterium magnum TaxID=1692 RepID=A0A087BBI3_9BIFI|nr:DUF4125 family protein [Bifidobacterium magnum]KFI68383.1 hypothetical protein BMAGN_0344 [Bifidobacterium magnum]